MRHRPIAVLAAVLAAAALAAGAAAQPAKRALTLDDLARLRSVREPHVSPDGQWVAYVVGTVDADKDKRDSDLWMVRWDGSQTVRLTATAESAERRPLFSPDGRYLAFLAARGDEDEKKKGAQVWLLNRAGGEAQKLTDAKGGVSDFAWSPDGTRLVLVVGTFDPASDPEKMEGWKRKTEPPIVVDRYQFKTDGDGYLKRFPSHLSLFDLETRKEEPLTAGPYDESQPSWSPDGRTIAFVSNRAAPDPDRSVDTNIFTIEARPGAEPRQVTTYPGHDDGHPSWSPDGKSIAYYQGDEAKYAAYELNKLAVVPAAGGASRLLTPALDRSGQGDIVWAEDGKSLCFVVEDDRASYVGRVAAAGGAVEKLTTGRRTVQSLGAARDGAFAVLSATASEPADLFALEKGQLRRLTRENPWLEAVQLAAVDDFTAKAKDGTQVNGLVTKPAGFAAGKKYPAILYIHGGPVGQDDYDFDFNREIIAASGYLVLQPNYRGSSGRGAEYQKAIFADWGNKEVVDLLASVDWAVAAGLADPDRLGLGGWSYGGILTNYTIATDPRFKAAVSGASSSLQLSMYGSDQYIVQYENELGLPWKSREAWLKVSYPFFQMDRIRTPTLFQCGVLDFNVPIVGVEQMYQGLKSLGVDTQLVIYPGQHHGITTPSYARDRLERWLAWWGKYLK